MTARRVFGPGVPLLSRFAGDLQRDPPIDRTQSVVTNLVFLLNSRNLESAGVDLGRFPEARRSVVNFGVPELRRHGSPTAEEIRDLARVLAEAVATFEPRIVRGTLEIQPVLDDGALRRGAILFGLSGFLGSPAEPEPLNLWIAVDSNGRVEVTDHSPDQASR